MVALEIRGLTKSFAAHVAVSDVSLSVRSGEMLALVGPSGCGKSTLLRLIAGLETADSGSVRLGDREVTRVPAGQRAVGMVFQEPAAFPYLTVAENLAFGLRVRHVPARERTVRVADTAELLGITDLLARRPAQLSGGERQRVEIGRALLREPDVLLLDEPLASLDAALRLQMRDELRRIQAEVAMTTVLVTHDQSEAMAMGHQVAVMRAGRLEQVGTPADIFDTPADTFIARFVGAPPMNLVPLPSLPFAVLPPAGHADATVGIRPSDMEPVGRDQPDDALTADLRVTSIEDQGTDYVVGTVSEATGAAFVLRTPRTFHPVRDDVLRVRVHAWHLFDAVTGTRIGP